MSTIHQTKTKTEDEFFNIEIESDTANISVDQLRYEKHRKSNKISLHQLTRGDGTQLSQVLLKTMNNIDEKIKTIELKIINATHMLFAL